MTTETIIDVKNKIRAVNDFPKQGIVFRDITTALKDAETLKVMIDYLCDQFKNEKIDYIAGIESRGFIFGMPMAYKLNAGFVPIRKPNKLPAATYSQEYELEYGTDKIEVHQDAFPQGARQRKTFRCGKSCFNVNLLEKSLNGSFFNMSFPSCHLKFFQNSHVPSPVLMNYKRFENSFLLFLLIKAV